ncbi:hypothetical protein ABZ403_00590 [Micromonospora zamorensis]
MLVGDQVADHLAEILTGRVDVGDGEPVNIAAQFVGELGGGQRARLFEAVDVLVPQLAPRAG